MTLGLRKATVRTTVFIRKIALSKTASDDSDFIRIFLTLPMNFMEKQTFCQRFRIAMKTFPLPDGAIVELPLSNHR